MAEREVDVRAVDAGALDDLATLFGTTRGTRSCWCTAFCTTGGRFALGWVSGRNRRHFETVAQRSSAPMGVLATDAGRPVGWAACGPRSRYVVAQGGRSALLADVDHAEDDDTWLVACLFVHPDHRGRGLTGALVAGAVQTAREHGAGAVEGWPVTGDGPAPGTDFVGRASVFAAAGFTTVATPAEGRALVRLALP